MRYRVISEQPFKGIIAKEWHRAIKILDPLLNNRRKPTFLWDRSMGSRTNGERGCRGRCYDGRSNTGFIKFGGYKRWWKAPVITISTYRKDEALFTSTLRHELIHLIQGRHDNKFWRLLNELK